MFIVWGTRGYEKLLGKSVVYRECPNCHNTNNYIIKKIGSKFALFWIPLFTISSKYYMICPICNHGTEITKEQAKEYLVEDEAK